MKICGKIYKVGSFYKVKDTSFRFKIRHNFDWPEGYFSDKGKCWHNYNNATPTLFTDIGAKWLTIYNGKTPYGRCGILPLFKYYSNQWLFFNLTVPKVQRPLTLSDVAIWFLKDEYKIAHNTVHNRYLPNYHDDKIFYTNGGLIVHPIKSYPLTDVYYNEEEYQNCGCDYCGFNYIYKYRDYHQCNQHHYISEEFKK